MTKSRTISCQGKGGIYKAEVGNIIVLLNLSLLVLS